MEILTLPARRMIIYETKENIYQMTDEAYEFNLRKFKQALRKNNLSYSTFSRVGSIIEKEDFKNKIGYLIKCLCSLMILWKSLK